MRPLRLAAEMAAPLLCLTPLAAQDSPFPHHNLTNSPVPSATGGHGDNVQSLRDWDGDGYQDYAVAAPNFELSTGFFGGRVYVYSGRSTALLATFDGLQSAKNFGGRIGDIGDATGDGVFDLVIAAHKYDAGFGNTGAVFLYDGATGAKIWTFGGDAASGNVGTDLGVTGDYTGDGVLDLVVCDPGWGAGTGQGRVHFVNGATGALVGTTTGDLFFTSFGKRIAARPETTTVLTSDAKGAVYSMSPPVLGLADKTLLYPAPAGATSDSAELDFLLGPTGTLRVLIGRRYADPAGLGNAGTIEIFEVGAPVPLLTIDGAAALEFVGSFVTRVPDTDGDGVEDFAFSSESPTTTGQRFRTASQAGALLDDIIAGGVTVIYPPLDAIADVTGDGRSDLLSGNANGGQSWLLARGLELATSGATAGAFSATFDVNLGAVNGGGTYLQLYGTSGSAPGTMGLAGWPLLPLNLDGVTFAALNAVGTATFPDAFGVLDGLGKTSTSMNLSAAVTPTLAGIEVTTTVFAFGGGGSVAATSNPVFATVVN